MPPRTGRRCRWNDNDSFGHDGRAARRADRTSRYPLPLNSRGGAPLKRGSEYLTQRRKRNFHWKIGRSVPAWQIWDWSGTITAFKLAALRDPRNADIQNYIGYAHRRLRQLGLAMQHYQQALLLNWRHRRATEHLVKLYPVLGEPTKGEDTLQASGHLPDPLH